MKATDALRKYKSYWDGRVNLHSVVNEDLNTVFPKILHSADRGYTNLRLSQQLPEYFGQLHDDSENKAIQLKRREIFVSRLQDLGYTVQLQGGVVISSITIGWVK